MVDDTTNKNQQYDLYRDGWTLIIYTIFVGNNIYLPAIPTWTEVLIHTHILVCLKLLDANFCWRGEYIWNCWMLIFVEGGNMMLNQWIWGCSSFRQIHSESTKEAGTITLCQSNMGMENHPLMSFPLRHHLWRIFNCSVWLPKIHIWTKRSKSPTNHSQVWWHRFG
jgi:hypothetical protein